VRVCWQEPDCAGGRAGVPQYGMRRCDDRDWPPASMGIYP
jgi:hypothetical protein